MGGREVQTGMASKRGSNTPPHSAHTRLNGLGGSLADVIWNLNLNSELRITADRSASPCKFNSRCCRSLGTLPKQDIPQSTHVASINVTDCSVLHCSRSYRRSLSASLIYTALFSVLPQRDMLHIAQHLTSAEIAVDRSVPRHNRICHRSQQDIL